MYSEFKCPKHWRKSYFQIKLMMFMQLVMYHKDSWCRLTYVSILYIVPQALILQWIWARCFMNIFSSALYYGKTATIITEKLLNKIIYMYLKGFGNVCVKIKICWSELYEKLPNKLATFFCYAGYNAAYKK